MQGCICMKQMIRLVYVYKNFQSHLINTSLVSSVFFRNTFNFTGDDKALCLDLPNDILAIWWVLPVGDTCCSFITTKTCLGCPGWTFYCPMGRHNLEKNRGSPITHYFSFTSNEKTFILCILWLRKNAHPCSYYSANQNCSAFVATRVSLTDSYFSDNA